MKSNAYVRCGSVASLLVALVGLQAVVSAGSADTDPNPHQSASPRDVFRSNTLGSDFAAWPFIQRAIKSLAREDEIGKLKRRVLLGKRPRLDDDNDRMTGGLSSKRKTMLGKRVEDDGDDLQPEREASLERGLSESGTFVEAKDKRRVMLGKRPMLEMDNPAWSSHNYGNQNERRSSWQGVRLGKRPDGSDESKRRILLGKRPDGQIGNDSKRRILLGKRLLNENKMKKTVMFGKRPNVGVVSEMKRRILLGKRPGYAVADYAKRKILLGKRRVLPDQGQNSNSKPAAWQRTLLGKRAATFEVGKGRVRLGRSHDDNNRQIGLIKRPFGGSSYKWDLPSAPNVRDERR